MRDRIINANFWCRELLTTSYSCLVSSRKAPCAGENLSLLLLGVFLACPIKEGDGVRQRRAEAGAQSEGAGPVAPGDAGAGHPASPSLLSIASGPAPAEGVHFPGAISWGMLDR